MRGGLLNAQKKKLISCLEQKHPFNVTHLTTGGIAEMFYGTGNVEQIVLKKRKGFCKMALRTGAHLVPCYYMGLNQSMYRLGGQGTLLYEISRKLQVSLVAWLDRFYIPYGGFPRRHPMLVALGAAIPVTKVPTGAEPTVEQIDELHETFCTAMRALFDKHKTDPIFCTEECPQGWATKHLYFEDEIPKPEPDGMTKKSR